MMLWISQNHRLDRSLRNQLGGAAFPRGSVFKNPPGDARDINLIPGQEDPGCCRATKPVHTTAEPTILEAVLSTGRETTASSSPGTVMKSRPYAAKKDPPLPKNK